MHIKSERIKELREKYGLTLKEVASRLDISEASASRYERNEVQRVSPKIIYGYSQLFHVPVNELYENPETEWVPAFTGAGMMDPRVQGFISYLEEKAAEEEAQTFSHREMRLIEYYRLANEKTRIMVDMMLDMPGEEKKEGSDG